MEVVIIKENYENEVLKSEKPVLLDFWATWCGPCASLKPTIVELANENNDLKVCTVDVDENKDLAREYKVMSIPTVIALKDGKEIGRIVGPESKEQILGMFS